MLLEETQGALKVRATYRPGTTWWGGLEVTTDRESSDFEKFVTLIAAGTPPDVGFATLYNWPSFAEREIFVISFKDVTEQKAAARERNRQQALMNALFNAIPDMIVYKDTRGLYRAVVAARAAQSSWANRTAYNRAQILYYLAENLSSRADDFAALLDRMTGGGMAAAHAEVEASVSRLFTYGAWADKYDGAVHNVPIRGVALAMNEPVGVMGIICPEDAPLLALVSLVLQKYVLARPRESE